MEYREFLAAEDKQFRAHLEEHQRVIGGVLEEVKAQGGRIAQETAQAVKASGKEAVAQAQASLDQVGQAAQMTGELALKAGEMAVKTVERSAEVLGRVEQASERMVASEAQVEQALNDLLPKVAGVRESLEKELGDVVRATAATEAEVKRMVAAIQSRVTEEMEQEIRAKLSGVADQAANRIYSLGKWWEGFTKVGIPAVLVLFAVVSGGMGWWYGKHQLDEDIYQRALERMRANGRVQVWSYRFSPGPVGGLKHEFEPVNAPLVWLGDGKYAAMVQDDQGRWVYGSITVPRESLVLAEAYDGTMKENNLISSNKP